MRKVIGLVIPLLLLIVPVPATLHEGEPEAVEVVHDNVIRFGETITLSGTIDGDAIVGAQSVIVPKGVVINGDLIGFANTVSVEGTVKGSVRVAAQNLGLGGVVERNVTAAANTVTFSGGSTVHGTTAVLADQVTLAGSFERSVTVHAARVELGGNFLGDVTLKLSHSPAAEIVLKPPLAVAGTLHYRAPNPIDRIGDHVKDVKYEPITGPTFSASLRSTIGFGRSIQFLGTLIIGLVLLWLFPKFIPLVTDELRARTGKDVLTGIILFFAVPIAVFLLALSFVGIPLAVLLALIYGIVLGSSKIFVGALVGSLLAARFAPKLDRYLQFALGYIALELVLSVLLKLELGPVSPLLRLVGGVSNLFIAAWVPGALARLFGRRVRPPKASPGRV